jgi:hypothetical protein
VVVRVHSSAWEVAGNRWLRRDHWVAPVAQPEGRGGAAAKRRIRQLESELAVSRKVNEVFLEQNLPPKASTR